MKWGQETNHIRKQEAGTQDTHDRGLTPILLQIPFSYNLEPCVCAFLLVSYLSKQNQSLYTEYRWCWRWHHSTALACTLWEKDRTEYILILPLFTVDNIARHYYYQIISAIQQWALYWKHMYFSVGLPSNSLPSWSWSSSSPWRQTWGCAFTSRLRLSQLVCSRDEPATAPTASSMRWLTSCWEYNYYAL